ncbi:sulfite exporter TauE/SafE family protein [Phragmitibacter flavus]|uniref:Sulfite exporter TauE/SafE family protein n=1 Tax=Phragmitibacter flavus TaxID=2576071 RepID=A0A5R8KET2_9BACT|nr:sulfite exporter TauE/SafE family protein [Phragmitibacter flavus]TLD70804.1 sulfite exporter TauE/SafE family protein [Phragmitibacter flavus]
MPMPAIDTTATAFFAGLVTSLHCVGMCGPMACAWAGKASSQKPTPFIRDTTLYHAARLLSYTVIGAIAGTIGIMPMQWFQHGPALILPWLLVGLFIIIAFGLERWLPKPRFLTMPMARLKLWALRRPPFHRAIIIGLATPLIPCGPLYLMLGLAVANGSTIGGASFALAFGFGTLPLLWLMQTQLQWLNLKLTPVRLRQVQRSLALLAVFIMIWRLRGTFTGEPDTSCCHPSLITGVPQ